MRNTKIEQQVFPEVFCVEDVQCMPGAKGGYDYRAVLYHDQACITVSYNAVQRDPRLIKGCFVSVYWPVAPIQSDHGAIKVAGLGVRSYSASDFNPFRSVPHTRNMDRHLIDRARALWDSGSKATRRMLLAILDVHAERW